MKIGAHVSVAGGVDNAVQRQLDVGGNCGQIFTHSPQVWQTPDISEEEADRFRTETTESLEGPWVIHSCYLVNVATPKDDLRQRSIVNIQAELDAAAVLEIPYVNIHLGAHTGAGVAGGLDNAVDALDELEIPADVTLLIETDAGSGTKLGGEFEELQYVLDESRHALEACMDTAHSFVAGYDLRDRAAVEKTVAEFDDIVGLDRLACLHLNDSKHPLGSNKDEHAHLGEGEIGPDGIQAILTNPELSDRPFILETPNEDGRGFAWNIERARELAGA